MRSLLLLILSVSVLSEVVAQTIKWGKEFTATLNSANLGELIEGSINNNIYMVENPVKTNQVNTNEKNIKTSLRIFKSANKLVKEILLSDILSKKIKANPEKIYVADVVIWKNELKVFFTVDRDSKSNSIFYVQSLSENGEAMNDPIEMGNIHAKKGIYKLDTLRSLAYRAAQNFQYAISPDSSKFVQLNALLDPDSKKYNIYLHTFDYNFKLLNTTPLEIETSGMAAEILTHKVNDRGNIYILVRTPKSRKEMKENKKQYPYVYEVHVSTMKNDKTQFGSKILTLPGDQSVTNAKIFINNDNELLITGTYTDNSDKIRGQYHAGYFAGGFSGFSTDIKLKPFPTTEAFFDQIAASQKKDLRTTVITIDKIFYPPIPRKIIQVPNQGHYVIAEVSAITIIDGFFEKELFSYDLLAYFINLKNEITWYKHIPKRQEFNAHGYGYCNMQNILGFLAYVDVENRLNIIHLDKKENDIPDGSSVDVKIAKINIIKSKNNTEGLTHLQYDLTGTRIKRAFYELPEEYKENLLASARMTMSANTPVFLTYKLGRQKAFGLNHSTYCLAELPR